MWFLASALCFRRALVRCFFRGHQHVVLPSVQLAPQDLSCPQVTSWQCGFWVLELAKLPILGLLTFWPGPGLSGRHSLFTCCPPRFWPVPSVAVAPPGSCPPPPSANFATLRRPVPQDFSQTPLSERRAPSSGRWYCPVQSCPDHCSLASRGWSSFVAMKGHFDRHLGGYLDGELPLGWLQSVGYGVCEVCNRILSSRCRGRCPSCWPTFIASLPRPVTGRPLSEDMPPLDQVLSARVRLRSSVPRGARDLWGTCLNKKGETKKDKDNGHREL